MKPTLWIALALCLSPAALATGCTVIRYQDFSYYSILQEKSLTITAADDKGQPLSFGYSTNSDPAVEAFKAGVVAGAAAAGVANPTAAAAAAGGL